MTTYITHFCANKKCNNAWVDVDLKRSSAPPKWKKCRDCAGPEFDKQVPKVSKKLSKRLSSVSKVKYQERKAS